MPEHEAIVPTAGGVRPMCSCGFVGGPPGRTMAEHLQDVAERSERSIATETCQQRGCSEPAVATVKIDVGPGDARTAYAVSERVQLVHLCKVHAAADLDDPHGSVPSLARGRSQRRGGVRTLALPLRDRADSETLTLVGPDAGGRYSLQLSGVTMVGRASGLDRDHLANQVAHLLIRLEADAAGAQ